MFDSHASVRKRVTCSKRSLPPARATASNHTQSRFSSQSTAHHTLRAFPEFTSGKIATPNSQSHHHASHALIGRPPTPQRAMAKLALRLGYANLASPTTPTKRARQEASPHQYEAAHHNHPRTTTRRARQQAFPPPVTPVPRPSGRGSSLSSTLLPSLDAPSADGASTPHTQCHRHPSVPWPSLP